VKENKNQSLEGEFSGFSLEAWLCGQVRPELEEEVGAWLRTDERARKQLADLQASNRQILEKYPADWMMSELASRLQATRPQPRPGTRLISKAWLAIPAAAALLLVLLFNPARPQPKAGERQAADRIIIKGGSAAADLTGSLQVHRRDKEAIEVLRDGSEVRPGELLQLSYWLSTDAYGMIISIDGLGMVTQHFPLEGGGSLIRGRRRIFLPYAIELDQAPRFERFYLIVAPRPFAAPELLARIKGSLPGVRGRPLLKLELPPGFVQTALTLVKKPLTAGRRPNKMDKS
jgi:hypothetical protein